MLILLSFSSLYQYLVLVILNPNFVKKTANNLTFHSKKLAFRVIPIEFSPLSPTLNVENLSRELKERTCQVACKFKCSHIQPHIFPGNCYKDFKKAMYTYKWYSYKC